MIFKNILMCKPRYFDVIHYKLNAHMVMKNTVNYQNALTQWNLLNSKLNSYGANVHYIKPQQSLVDMVFAANGALIYNNKALVSNFNAFPRKPETPYYMNFFKLNNYDTFVLKTEFEGAGDGLFSHNKQHLWLGHGFRSNQKAYYEIKNILDDDNLNIHTLKLIKDKWYHLDTCFCPIGHEHLLLYESAFSEESLHKIYNVFDEKNCIKISDEDALNFACNSICIPFNKKSSNNYKNPIATIIGNKFSGKLKNKLVSLNYHIIENNMSEFLLSGGSTKCCVLDIEKELPYSKNNDYDI